MMKDWNNTDIPFQHGRSVVITGTGGLGHEDALVLAQAGANVIIAGRNPVKGKEAVRYIRTRVAKASVRFEMLDLASLASIDAFSIRLNSQLDSLDLLINNAGIMMPPERQVTEDGFELQFGTNYLGHFALTAQLMALLRKAKEPRVITLSSLAARDGVINFDDLQAEQTYKAMKVYSQSKLACLMFALELQRRSNIGEWGISSLAVHPGLSRTDLLQNGAGKWSILGLLRTFLWFMFQPVAQGALTTLYAATSPEAVGGQYYGPNKMNEMRGYPTMAKIPAQALDVAAASRLWEISERLSRTFLI